MPRLKRHASRCRSTPTEPPVVPDNLSNVAASSEPIPESFPHDELYSHPDANQSTEANLCPSRRESKKYWTVDLKDVNGQITKARLRVNDVFVLLGGKKIILEWNELGQPIRESGGLLGQFLGHVASEFNNFPISYTKIISYRYEQLRDNRRRLFTECYDLALSWEANLEKRATYIPREQWAGFLEYRMNEKTQRQTLIIEACKKFHTLLEMKTGRTCNRAEIYAISHKKKDGSYVNDEARQKILQTQTQLSSEDDAYTTIPTSRAGGSLSSNYILKSEYDTSMEKMQKKIKMEENDAEIKSLKNALAYMMQHMGGSLLSSFPNINEVEDLDSPAPV
ncbi:hypothetical protein CDL12_04411 [Handroanthus impetiginosus]|uniref:Uncharacterized protein n=1 Tax=Handroanthus impetiginosus TaxID=429701 RepID=A0A2G9HZC5_9LAMI|nr:hypothetical protein CDL12_04411 [Handroanthus impetiginosus]